MTNNETQGKASYWSLPLLLSEEVLLPKLAVTGGIASGKSTVVRFLNELGLASISADQIVRDLREDPVAMGELGEALGEKRPAGYETLREALKHQDKRRTVNAFFHGRVWEILKNSPAQVVEVPLLVESCLWPFFKTVWTVECSAEIRLNRLAERLGDRGAAENLLKIQACDPTRATLSDLVLNSNCTLDELNFSVLKGFRSLTHGIG